jgi:hypothetical protein
VSDRRKHALGALAVVAFVLILWLLDGIIGGNVYAAEPLKGWASRYDCTAGYCGQPTVALPSKLGGRYDGTIYAYATVCADRCAIVPAVDFCLCHVEPSSHPDRIVDLNAEAWALVTDQPPGLVPVTIIVEPVQNRQDAVPDTAIDAVEILTFAVVASIIGAVVIVVAVFLLLIASATRRR